MGYTSFGEFMRILRIRNHEVMGDTAKFLGVKVPFISAVESGKRNVPGNWIPRIIDHYNLDASEQNQLINAVENSRTQMKLDLSSANSLQRKVAIQFQRSFEKLDDDTAEAIMDLLKKEDDHQ